MIQSAHKKTLLSGLVGVAVVVVAYFVLVYPLQRKAVRIAAEQARTSEDLRRSGFPLAPKKLQRLRGEIGHKRKAAYRNFTAVYKKLRGPIAQEVDRYDSVETFCRSIQRFDYQEYYEETVDALAAAGVFLYGDVLGLSENSSADQDYHLLCHLWTVRILALTARSNDLELADPSLIAPPPLETATGAERMSWARQKKYPPASIRILPVRRYATKQDTIHFAEEFPVRISMRGAVGDVVNFLHAITEEKAFFPLERIEISKIGTNARDDRVEATITLGLFLMLGSQDSLVQLGDDVLITKPLWRPGT